MVVSTATKVWGVRAAAAHTLTVAAAPPHSRLGATAKGMTFRAYSRSAAAAEGLRPYRRLLAPTMLLVQRLQLRRRAPLQRRGRGRSRQAMLRPPPQLMSMQRTAAEQRRCRRFLPHLGRQRRPLRAQMGSQQFARQEGKRPHRMRRPPVSSCFPHPAAEGEGVGLPSHWHQ